MPIYEYKCNSCGKRNEILQKISDPPAQECPSCHANELKRVISASAFHLKGTGWYVTDFRDKGKPKTKADTETETKTETETETKKETKTETKSEKSTESSSSEKPTKKESSSTEKK